MGETRKNIIVLLHLDKSYLVVIGGTPSLFEREMEKWIGGKEGEGEELGGEKLGKIMIRT